MVEIVTDPITPQSGYTSKSALTHSQQIDSCHPYFLSPSDSLEMNLLNVTSMAFVMLTGAEEY